MTNRDDGSPIGVIGGWPTPTPNPGYLFCDGAEVSRTRYAALFRVIGTTFGQGDGVTTFNLPVGREIGHTEPCVIKAEISETELMLSYELIEAAQLLRVPGQPAAVYEAAATLLETIAARMIGEDCRK